ncbi:hypothetical protein Tco_0401709 [Tanacetum coccineum]
MGHMEDNFSRQKKDTLVALKASYVDPTGGPNSRRDFSNIDSIVTLLNDLGFGSHKEPFPDLSTVRSMVSTEEMRIRNKSHSLSFKKRVPLAFNTMTLTGSVNAKLGIMDTVIYVSSLLKSSAHNLSTIFNSRMYPSVLVGDGKSIPVTNTGHSTLPTPYRPLHINNVLVTPNIVKFLISYSVDTDSSLLIMVILFLILTLICRLEGAQTVFDLYSGPDILCRSAGLFFMHDPQEPHFLASHSGSCDMFCEKDAKEADATPRVNIQDFCEGHYEDILPVIMDKIRRDKRKEVHARLDFKESPRKKRIREGSQNSSARTLSARYRNPLERLKVRERLRYNDRHVLDRLGHRRQSAFDRLNDTYSPSTTKSGPDRANFKDRSHSRSRPHKAGSF